MAYKGRKPGPKGSRLSTELRRVEVIKLRAIGWNTYALAEKFGVTHQTISEDIEIYLERVKSESKDRVATERELDLIRIDDSLRDVEACMAALRVEAKNGEREASQVIARLIDTRCKLLDRRAKLLGTDAPSKSEVTGKDGAALSGNLTPAMVRSFVEEEFGRVGPKGSEPQEPAASDLGTES